MAKVKLKNRKGIKIAYIEHVGAYDTIPFDDLIRKLYAWAKESRARPGFKPMAVYPDDPKITPVQALRSWVAIPIAGDPQPGKGVSIIELPEALVASYVHAALASEYGNSYGQLSEWAEKNGYEFAGPPLEIYYKKPKNKHGQTIIYAEIQFPVKKA